MCYEHTFADNRNDNLQSKYSLPNAIRQRESRAMLDNARLTRKAPDSPEKAAEAKRQVRAAMYKFALDQITE